MSFLGDVASMALNKVKYKVKQAAYDPQAEAEAREAEVVAQAMTKSSPKSNVEAFNQFKTIWGQRAALSGRIDKKYLDTYKSILSIPAPAENVDKATFDSLVNVTADTIRQWYVDSKYSGDLSQLSEQINASKPTYLETSITEASAVEAPQPLAPPQTPTQEFLSAAWKAFLFGLLIFWLLAIALLAGRIAACDAIGRSPLIRFLYFIYAAIFFPLVIPYYIYRYFKGTFPYTGYGLLPLYEGITTNIFLRPFSYIADANVAAKKEALLKAGQALIA
jgi:hypothetical protein